MNKNIPNLITISRIALIPLFLYFIIVSYNCNPTNLLGIIISIFIFIILAVTDKIDGLLARKYNIVSELGKFLDPMADKCLMIAGLGVLVFYNRLSWIIAGVLVLREVFITIYRLLYVKRKAKIIAAGNLGKAKQVSFFIICPITFLPFVSTLINNILFLPVVAFSVCSAIGYYVRYR
ncbi:MAG: CDP-diacylglycerol--glycerol-3-phosphate 3-phosphatidyltransferase [Bifidobacteriaceae bacterium]|jgi:CDP-diacylglycerol--glycerol-3-phosphate 3-phosphatidyltransferase|nr:CDP-diacylglycerol--glycerol-3-phosphate 3-phosphatidyltransferase [Bifidobacteriaceae bacterium]